MKKLHILVLALAVVFALEVVFIALFCIKFFKPFPQFSESAKPDIQNPISLKIPSKESDNTTDESKDREPTELIKVPDEDGLLLHEKQWEDRLDKYVTIAELDNDVTSYIITGKSGVVLYSEEIYWRTAEIKQIDTNVLMYIFQAGTGPATNSAIFCDVENDRVSESFEYVLLAEGEYVFCGGHENGNHFLAIQNIFDPSKCNEKIELSNCSPMATDVICDIKITGKGKAVVTYLTGADYKETEVEITFP